MRLIIVRHAETTYNAKGVMQGNLDTDLNEKGRKQAELLAVRLAKEKIDVVYSSDLKRCRQTIQPFLDKSNVSVYFKEVLRERDFGIFEGKSISEYDSWKEDRGWMDFDFKIPEGESYNDVLNRAKLFLDEILKNNKGKTVLVVTHGGMKRVILMNLFDRKDQEYFDETAAVSSNTALTILNLRDDGNHETDSFYSVEHLEEER